MRRHIESIRVTEDQRRSSAMTVGPVQEPVSVDELRQHLRIETRDEDDYLAGLIQAAREMVETDTRRALCTQTRVLRLDDFPWGIELDRIPVQSISSIKYYDLLNTQQTLDSSQYDYDLAEVPPIVVESHTATWPATYERVGAVEVTFVCGHTSISAVPGMAKQAILRLAAGWYSTREAEVVGTISTALKLSYDSLIGRLKWGDYR
ncbi:MAG: hypothetical protein EBR82_23595 [Caulobacteraceae bacterium]|nr:hypothetical protein [Caulobacteraceae bacterium]